jgi:RNA polymerase sigma-70 factor (ECF subfamily)
MIAALVEQARDDSLPVDQQHAAFAELVRRFEEAAFAWALQRVHDPEEARDVCQEAFLKAWLKLRQLRDPVAFPGWLKRIVMRSGVEDRQSCLSGQAGLPLLHPGGSGDFTTLLNEQEQRVVILFYHLGYKLDEIAAMLDIPRGTVGKRLYTARIKIRRTLPRSVRLQFQRPSRNFLQQVREGLFDEYTGTYRFVKRPGLTVTISREGDHLVSDSNGQRSVLASLREGALVTTAFDAEGKFERNRRGRVVQFVYYEFGQRLGIAKKVHA